MKKSVAEIACDIFFTLFLGIVIAFLITRVVAPVSVIGTSMDPTYSDGEKLMVNQLAYRFKSPEYGDIIIFKPMDDIRQKYVKRIIGVPGDVIEVTRDKVYRNGVPLDETYIKEPMFSDLFEPYELKEDEYFVLGDNRNNSKDSRYLGPVNIEYIIGEVMHFRSR